MGLLGDFPEILIRVPGSVPAGMVKLIESVLLNCKTFTVP